MFQTSTTLTNAKALELIFVRSHLQISNIQQQQRFLSANSLRGVKPGVNYQK